MRSETAGVPVPAFRDRVWKGALPGAAAGTGRPGGPEAVPAAAPERPSGPGPAVARSRGL